jgi:hypothetical protein
MTPLRSTRRGVPVDEFLQAIGEQLDRAQDSLAVKARTGRPLTWALKDMKVDLQVFVELDEQGQVLWRSAGPNETGASTVHLEFTTITRPMIEENTWSFLDDADPRSMEDLGAAADLSEDDRRRLGRMGVRTVGQLRRLSSTTRNPKAVEAMVGIPVSRLEAALRASARPVVTGQELVRRSDETLLRIHGANLHDGLETEVRLAGEPVEIVEAAAHQLLVRPLEHQRSGQIEVFTAGERATGFYRLPGAGTGNGNGNGHAVPARRPPPEGAEP